jgi:hypothetical protein
MRQDLIERLEAFLDDEGFTGISIQRASHDVTLSAIKGDTRFVAYLGDRVAVPSHALPHGETPDPSTIAALPQVPGVRTDPVTGMPGRSGGSGGPSRK